jgi:hypothetical protein
VNFIDTATDTIKHAPMSGVRRTRHSSRPTAGKSGWWRGARSC